jgi:hypothetical protein
MQSSRRRLTAACLASRGVRERRFFSSINYVMAVLNTVGVAWLTGYAIAVARGRAFLQRPRVVATSTI